MGIGRKGRSCAWPPSRGVTSKSPMHAGAASSLGLHARVARRARQRRRVYQSGKGTAANRGGSGWWPVCSARNQPRPAPRQRPGPAYGLVLLGDPPSFDEDDTDPHCCVKPLDAVALPSRAATAACRTRQGPTASCSAPMASRLRCLSTVYGPGCLPGHRDCLKRHDSLGFDAGRLLCPLVPRERSRGLARPPPAVSDVHPARDRAHGASGSIRPRRPSIERHGASVPTRVHLPPQLRHTRVSRKLRFGTWASPSTRYVWRARTGFPPAVWSPSLSGWLPTTPPQGGSHMGATIAPAPKRHQRNLLSTLAATALQADLAPRHYRIPPPDDRPPETPSAASSRRPVVTVRCASDLAPDEPRHRAHHRLAGAGHRDAGPPGAAAGLRHRNRSRRASGVRPAPAGGRGEPEAGRRMASRREAPPLPTDATTE